MISIVIPYYNEQDALPHFYYEIKRVLLQLNVEYELLFVDDGSKDNTINILKQFAEENQNVYYYSFSRNFGKEAAMYAGLSYSRGEYVAIMDADMQDPPCLLPKMLDIIKKDNYDSVATRRVDRSGEPAVRSFFARSFYRIINKISETEVVDGARDFRLMKRKMVDAIVSMCEYNRFSKGIFGWVGFKTYWLPYENVERVAGETKWSFWKLFKYAVDGIINFSQIPLSLSSWFGVFMTFCSFFMLAFIILRKVIFGDPVAGWASTVCIIVFIGGIQMFCLGIMGQYLAKTYMESKKRPHFIIDETNSKTVNKNVG